MLSEQENSLTAEQPLTNPSFTIPPPFFPRACEILPRYLGRSPFPPRPFSALEEWTTNGGDGSPLLSSPPPPPPPPRPGKQGGREEGSTDLETGKKGGGGGGGDRRHGGRGRRRAYLTEEP